MLEEEEEAMTPNELWFVLVEAVVVAGIVVGWFNDNDNDDNEEEG